MTFSEYCDALNEAKQIEEFSWYASSETVRLADRDRAAALRSRAWVIGCDPLPGMNVEWNLSGWRLIGR